MVITFIVVNALLISQHGMAYELSSLSCTVAVTEPMWDDCAGTYTLDNGDNDVTNGDSSLHYLYYQWRSDGQPVP